MQASLPATAPFENDPDLDYDHTSMVLPGFRFHPTEEELVDFYLKRMVFGKQLSIEFIKLVDLYRYDPWQLPALAFVGEKEWFFFTPRDKKYRNGARPNRVTASGYWKATGTDRMVRNSHGNIIGLKKTLVFYVGRAPKGSRTNWVMNEYRLLQNAETSSYKNEVALCRVYRKSNSVGQYDGEASASVTMIREHNRLAASTSSSIGKHSDGNCSMSFRDLDLLFGTTSGVKSDEVNSRNSLDEIRGMRIQANEAQRQNYVPWNHAQNNIPQSMIHVQSPSAESFVIQRSAFSQTMADVNLPDVSNIANMNPLSAYNMAQHVLPMDPISNYRNPFELLPGNHYNFTNDAGNPGINISPLISYVPEGSCQRGITPSSGLLRSHSDHQSVLGLSGAAPLRHPSWKLSAFSKYS